MSSPWQSMVEQSLGVEHAQWVDCGHSGWGRSYSLHGHAARYFVKSASGRYASTLESEADGLAALRSTKAIRVPEGVARLASNDTSILVLEWLDIGAARDDAALGSALAALHRATPPHGPDGERYGWTRDNWIGGTLQHNQWTDDWCAFFREQRLAPQLALADRHRAGGRIARDGERLLTKLAALLRGHAPQPSLLHGDLWAGNAAALAGREPVVFDPAVYVGDREADIAMTELFGGFGPDFYAAYNDAWPLERDYEIRRDVYNLYHVLNHLNLFGGSYRQHAEGIVARLLAITG
ncbi:MAG TPA: fructosamine kinase family protein [Casimicrobiaceae bacterium]